MILLPWWKVWLPHRFLTLASADQGGFTELVATKRSQVQPPAATTLHLPGGAYYQQATDKEQAIVDMLDLRDPIEFLQLSGYDRQEKR